MKKKIIIFIIAMTLNVFTGCQNAETDKKETMQDNKVSSEEEKDDKSQDLDIEINENENPDNAINDNEGNNNSDKEITDNEIQNSGEVSNNNDSNNSYTGITDKENENENSDDLNNNIESSDNLDNESSTNDNEVESNEDVDGQDVLNGELSSIIEKIYGIKDTGLMVENTSVDLSNMDSVNYYTGLNDVSKVKEALVSEAMIGSQAYSLVLARVNDSVDAESVANEMLTGINPNKWICVSADDLQVVTHDDLIMLIMVSSSFEDTVTSQQIVDAFKEICGYELDIELKN